MLGAVHVEFLSDYLYCLRRIFHHQTAPTIPSGETYSEYMAKLDSAVLIHEICHLYNLPDHSAKNGCIMSSSVYDKTTLDTMSLCDNCYKAIMTYRDLYSHQ